MSTPGTPPTFYSLRMTWPKEQPKAQLANQFAVTTGVPTEHGPDTIYLLVGHADPPFLSGTPEEVSAEAASLEALPIDVLGRFAFSRSRLNDLIALLQSAAESFDRAIGGEQVVDDAGDRR